MEKSRVPVLTTLSKNRVTYLLSLCSLQGEVRENLGNFQNASKILMFLSPLPHVPTFHKTNVLHNDLNKDAITKFGKKYRTSNPVWVKFQVHGSSFYTNIEEKVSLVKKYQLTICNNTTIITLDCTEIHVGMSPWCWIKHTNMYGNRVIGVNSFIVIAWIPHQNEVGKAWTATKRPCKSEWWLATKVTVYILGICQSNYLR